jgi:MATE family multidrug resistance protein
VNTSILRSALQLAGLAGLALLSEPLSGLADTAAAGYLGVSEQSALALGSGVVTTTTWLLTPLMFAQTTQIAGFRVAGDHARVQSTVRIAVILAAVWGLVLACAVTMFALTAVGDGDARAYLLVRAAGLPVSAVVLAGYGALRGAGHVSDVTALALGGAVIHVGIVVVSVAMDLGTVGIGAASGLAQLAVTVVGLRLLVRRRLWPRRVTPSCSGPDSWQTSLVAAGLLAVRSVLLGGATLAMTAGAVQSSAVDAAAHLVVYQVWLLVVLAVEGWKSAAQILVSSSRSDTERAAVEKTVLAGSAVLGSASAAAVFAIGPLATQMLSASEEVESAARTIWWLSAFSFVVGAVAFTRDGVEFGRGAFGVNLIRIGLGTGVTVVGAGTTWLTGDLRWMWFGMTIGLLVRAVWPYRSYGRKRHVRTISGSRNPTTSALGFRSVSATSSIPPPVRRSRTRPDLDVGDPATTVHRSGGRP